MKVSIAVCGRTNTGKTSFISTLRHEYSGEMKNEGNTTKKTFVFDHKTLNITISDMPGFEKMPAVEIFLKLQKTLPDFSEEIKNSILSDYYINRDYEILNDLKKNDIVFLVCSTDTPPDSSYETEIKLLKEINKNIIGIISKTGNVAKNDIIFLWEDLFRKYEIQNIVRFDAHFDDKNKIVQLMRTCAEYIKPKNKKDTFLSSVEKFKNLIDRQYLIVQDAFVELIQALNNTKIEIKNTNKMNPQVSNALKAKVEKDFELYRVKVAEAIGINLEDLKAAADKLNVSETILKSTYSGTGAVIGSLAGMIAVAAVISVTGPFAILLGKLGFWAGMGAGSLVGDSFVSNEKYIAQILPKDIDEFAKVCILIFWVASKFGYARAINEKDSQLKMNFVEFSNEFEQRYMRIKNIESYDDTYLRKWFNSAISEIEN